MFGRLVESEISALGRYAAEPNSLTSSIPPRFAGVTVYGWKQSFPYSLVVVSADNSQYPNAKSVANKLASDVFATIHR